MYFILIYDILRPCTWSTLDNFLNSIYYCISCCKLFIPPPFIEVELEQLFLLFSCFSQVEKTMMYVLCAKQGVAEGVILSPKTSLFRDDAAVGLPSTPIAIVISVQCYCICIVTTHDASTQRMFKKSLKSVMQDMECFHILYYYCYFVC